MNPIYFFAWMLLNCKCCFDYDFIYGDSPASRYFRSACERLNMITKYYEEDDDPLILEELGYYEA